MIFKNLESRQLYLRSLVDVRLSPSSYIMIMLDGRSFSSKVKNVFDRPFSSDFMRYMDGVALHIAHEFSGIRFGYIQSDEITLLMTSFDGTGNDIESCFNYRIQKLIGLIASEASGSFNKQIFDDIRKSGNFDDYDRIFSRGPFSFACKVWPLNSVRDVNGWFTYRQNDCINNSVSQVAQYHFRHSDLRGQSVSNMKSMLLDKGIDWESCNPGEKYGRLLHRVETEGIKIMWDGEEKEYNRSSWSVSPAPIFTSEEKPLLSLIPRLDI